MRILSAGTGTPDFVIPSLFHNTTVGAARPDNLAAVVLKGIDRSTADRHVFMPRFGAGSDVRSLTDAQVAAVATYVRTTFGPGGVVAASDVAVQRSGGTASPLLKLAQFGIAISALVALAACAWLGRRLLRQ